MTQNTLKIMLDYDCWPTWIIGENFENIDPSTIGVNSSLADKLIAWSDAFDATLNRDDPTNTHALETQITILEETGVALWQELGKELEGSYALHYHSLRLNKIYTSLSMYQKAILNEIE